MNEETVSLTDVTIAQRFKELLFFSAQSTYKQSKEVSTSTVVVVMMS
jgi:hypothetical protein